MRKMFTLEMKDYLMRMFFCGSVYGGCWRIESCPRIVS